MVNSIISMEKKDFFASSLYEERAKLKQLHMLLIVYLGKLLLLFAR